MAEARTSKPLRVLIVEDSLDDVALMVRELRRSGLQPDYQRVDTAQELAAALAREPWDVILCDYSMPGFTGTQALELVRASGFDTPFIFVSGTIGEEVAVAAMKAGAQDYVIKGNLTRLGPAIERELRDHEARRERRRAEGKLRQLQRAVEQSANLVVITDVEGTIEYVNPRFVEVSGYAAEELIGRRPSVWKSGATSEADYGEMWRTILSGRDWRGEFANRRKDGGTVFVSATISPIRDDSGRITHFIGIEEDITERKEIEAQLRRSQRLEAIGQLTGGMAHDFNNILTVVIGNLELLLEAKEAPDLTLARQALEAGLRGAELTRQLLAFARRQSLDARAVDLNALVSGTAELLRRTLGEHIELRLQLAADLWPAFADPAQLESAVTNLAINARDAMPAGGRLTFETANRRVDAAAAAEMVDIETGDYVSLAVSDTGSGIPPEILGRVFEPFFTTKPQGQGTGLGLSMVYGFARQSHGHVGIESEIGRGTTIRLYLPRAVGDGEPRAAGPADREQDAPNDATILIVEDKSEVRQIAARQLASIGCRVVEAENAAAALDILRSGRTVNLLFTDIVMPGGMSGIELARAARKLRPGLRVVFTSGFVDSSVRATLRAEDAASFLPKPYRKEDLARRIREALARNGSG